MNKRHLILIAVIFLVLSFTFGCVQTPNKYSTNATNTTTTNQTPDEKISENDNLDPALQEMQQLEGL